MQDLAEAASAVAAEEPHSPWLGGLTNHEDAFLPLHRMLLALHVAAAVPGPAPCSPANGALAAAAGARAPAWAAHVGARLQQAAEALLRAPLQLLLGNLLAQVLRIACVPAASLSMPAQCPAAAAGHLLDQVLRNACATARAQRARTQCLPHAR